MDAGLGIDTGGTYTDSVIVDLGVGKVLSKSKALTTRSDLTLGISESIGRLDASLLEDVRLVSVSSTLATNSIVEGKGCRVGLILVGTDLEQPVPVEEMVRIGGGHDLEGDPNHELDVDTAKTFALSVGDRVDAFAISSYLSVRNPEHEEELEKLLASLVPHPVVCGHELSSSLGFKERTATAVLNARLIPIIADLLHSVKAVLDSRAIAVPLMVVRGDGSLMSEEVAKERPIETILSGPAASLTGGRYLSGLDDAVVIDVGGTTTDIGILRRGRPRLDSEGALIGGSKTRVRAADISTSGIGGDSRVVVHNGQIHVAPLRVVPLCIASATHPHMVERLEGLKSQPPKPSAPHLDIAKVNQPVEFFMFNRELKGYELGSLEKMIIDTLKDGPRTAAELSESVRDHSIYLHLRRLEEMNVVQRIGLTPTDILHVDGTYVEFDARASVIGVDVMSGMIGMTPAAFCRRVRSAVIDKITTELIRKLVYEETGQRSYCDVAADFVVKFARHESGVDYHCRMHLNKKIIGIGAPVRTYLPEVAEKLSTELVLPEHMEVGNAVGAITGSIMESVEIVIVPNLNTGDLGNPPCTLHSPLGRRKFLSLSDAIVHARAEASEQAKKLAARSGADEIEVIVEESKIRMGLIRSESDPVVEVKVVATAVGKPYQFYVR